MPSKTQAISHLLQKVLEDQPQLQPHMFSTLEEMIKSNPSKKPMTIAQWSEQLKPGATLKKRDQETGKLAQFNLSSEELEQSRFNDLLKAIPEHSLTKEQLVETLVPYKVKFKKPTVFKTRPDSGTAYEDLSNPEGFQQYEQPKYPQYKNFDSVVNRALGKASGGSNRLTLPEFIAAQADSTHPQYGHVRNTVEMVRDMVEDNYDDVEIMDTFGIEGIPRDYGSTHDFFQNTPEFQERVYDDYIAMFDDFANDIIGDKAEALPEFLTKDQRRPKQYIAGNVENGLYPVVQGKHFTDDTISHSRVNRAPILGDSDYVLSEVQSDLEPYVNQLSKTTSASSKEIHPDKLSTLNFLQQAPFLNEYPRIEMNRVLAEALAAADTPDNVIYNNAFDANPSAPELMYTSRLPKEFKRLSRAYDIPLINTAEELTRRNKPQSIQLPDGTTDFSSYTEPGNMNWVNYTEASAQRNFSGALPVKEHLDYLRRIGVPFLSMSPLALMLQEQEDGQ